MPTLDTGQTASDAINQIYLSVLRRNADSSELSPLVVQFNAGTSLNTIRDTLVASTEASRFVDPVVRLYEVAFGRQADEAGLTNWVNAFRNGTALETIAQGFTGSQEFINRFGTNTDRSAFVESLYVNGLGRASDAAGKAGWVDSTLTDGQLLLGFSNSAESIARLDSATTSFLDNLSDGLAVDTSVSLTAVLDTTGSDTTQTSSIDLDDIALGTGGFKIIGETASDLAGKSVSSAGDVNGDGVLDFIIGASLNDAGGSDAGAAYVVFGAASGITSVNLDDVALGTGGFKIIGETDSDTAGFSVSSAGDVNGDGFSDVIVGAPGRLGGAAYVVFGAASGITSVNLDDIAGGIGGFKITGDGGGAGTTVSSAGDVNNDGFADLIVGTSGAGAAFVVYGAASGIASIDVSDVTINIGGFRINEENSGDKLGAASSAGDVNGDGFDDLIVGAYGNDNAIADTTDDTGAAYVVFGSATRIDSVNLDDVALGLGGFKIIGETAGDRVGQFVSAAGDVNGDGFADVIIGVPRNERQDGVNDTTGSNGAAYVVFGAASGITSVNLDDVALGIGGFKISGTGTSANGIAGQSVSSAGDVNGDGFDDLLVGTILGDGHDGEARGGVVYVVFGAASGITSIDLNDVIAGTGGFKIAGELENDFSGGSISSGDFNGDGFSDILIGAIGNAAGGVLAGAAYVIFGSSSIGAVSQLSAVSIATLTQSGADDSVALLGVSLVEQNAGDVLI